MYIKIYNKFKPEETMIVDELSDFLFEEGWRKYVDLTFITGDEYLQLDENKRQASIRQYGF